MTLSWNVVTKNMRAHEQVQRKLREKIAKLECHLQHFHPESVHLQVALARNPKRNSFTAALTLRVLSQVLRSEKSAADPIPALDQAVKALLRELSGFKSGVRGKTKRRRQAEALTGLLQFSPLPLPVGEGPQNLGEVVREIAAEQYEHLLFYIRRQVLRAQAEGLISQNAVDPEAVADEVCRQAIARPESKPDDGSYRLWLYALAHAELDRRIRELRRQSVTTVRLDETPADNEEEPLSPEIDERDATSTRIVNSLPDVSDGHSLPPDLAASESDLVDYLHQASQHWPSDERSVFELHFLEGFELDEVAMLEGMKLPKAQTLVRSVQARLRDLLTDAVQATVTASGPTARAKPKRRLDREAGPKATETSAGQLTNRPNGGK